MPIFDSSKATSHPLRGLIDVAVFTAIEPEEKAVAGILALKNLRTENLSREISFQFGNLESKLSDRLLNVAIFRQARGNSYAAALTALVQASLSPGLSVFVGICAGLISREFEGHSISGVKVGDVLVPIQINDFSLGVLTRTDNLAQVSPRMATYPVGGLAVRRFNYKELDQAVAIRDSYMKQLHREWNKKTFTFPGPGDFAPVEWQKYVNDHVNRLTIEVGDHLIASSNLLLRDQDALTHLYMRDDRCRGADMESAGFASACAIYNANAMVVRSVSDHGSQKTDEFHDLASANAAAFLKVYLVNRFDPNLTRAYVPNLREIRQTQLNRLVKLVLDSFATLMQEKFRVPINLEVYWVGEAVNAATKGATPGVVRDGDGNMRAERAGGLNRFEPRRFFPFEPATGEPRAVAKCGLMGNDVFQQIDGSEGTPLRWVYAVPIGESGSDHRKPEAVLCLTSTQPLTTLPGTSDETTIRLSLKATASLVRDVLAQIFSETDAVDIAHRVIVQHELA